MRAENHRAIFSAYIVKFSPMSTRLMIFKLSVDFKQVGSLSILGLHVLMMITSS